MNRMQFIKTIMELYPNTFHLDNENQFKGWVERYKQALPDNWDFDKLLRIFDREWKSTVVPPHPSFFLEFRNDVKPEKVYKQEVIDKSQLATPQQWKEIKERINKLAEERKLDK